MNTQASEFLLGMADAAVRFGPFLFCMIFLFFVIRNAEKMYRQFLSSTSVKQFDPRGWPYMLYFYGAIALSFALVTYSVYWWSIKQKDWYAFAFEIDGVPAEGQIEICNSKYVFYGRTSSDDTSRYKKYPIVVLRDEQMVKGYTVKLKYDQPQSQFSQSPGGTGCTLLVPYRGGSIKTFLLPSALPGPNDQPKPLEPQE